MDNQKHLRMPPDKYTKKEIGKYGEIHRDMKFYCERDSYFELYNSGKLLDYCKYIQRLADEKIRNIHKEYGHLGPVTTLNIEEDYVGSWAGNFKLEKYKKKLLVEVRNAVVHCLNDQVKSLEASKEK